MTNVFGEAHGRVVVVAADGGESCAGPIAIVTGGLYNGDRRAWHQHHRGAGRRLNGRLE